MPSPTRSAFAMMVKAGFTAPIEGRKLPSTTYKLSRSGLAVQVEHRRGGAEAEACGHLMRSIPLGVSTAFRCDAGRTVRSGGQAKRISQIPGVAARRGRGVPP